MLTVFLLFSDFITTIFFAIFCNLFLISKSKGYNNYLNQHIMKTNRNYKFAIICMVFGWFSMVAFAQDTPKLSDYEIASVALTANQLDIDNANIAIQRSKL